MLGCSANAFPSLLHLESPGCIHVQSLGRPFTCSGRFDRFCDMPGAGLDKEWSLPSRRFQSQLGKGGHCSQPGVGQAGKLWADPWSSLGSGLLICRLKALVGICKLCTEIPGESVKKGVWALSPFWMLPLELCRSCCPATRPSVANHCLLRNVSWFTVLSAFVNNDCARKLGGMYCWLFIREEVQPQLEWS